MRNLILLFALLIVSGCTHPIIITPDNKSLDYVKEDYFQAKVGYYISAQDREKKVVEPGGGGDKISYYPYKDLEPTLQKVLFSVFRDVVKLETLPTPEFLKANGVVLVFYPEISTSSYSKSLITWPPTSFTVILKCKAFASNGRLIWEKSYSGVGNATFSEFKGNFALAAKRAGQKVFSDLLRDLYRDPGLRKYISSQKPALVVNLKE